MPAPMTASALLARFVVSTAVALRSRLPAERIV